MKFSEYRKHCMRTAGDIRPEVVALGLIGEVGEVADLIKKHLGHGHPLDRDKVIEELGDLMWYVAINAGDSAEHIGHLSKYRPLQLETGLPVIELAKSLVQENFRTGRVLRLMSELARHVGSNLDEVAERNVAKLQRRYPDGFSVERSMNRGES